MRSFESSLAFVLAALAELQAYLRSSDLFWTLSSNLPPGSPLFLQLTLGNLLLALDALTAADRASGGAEWTEVQRLETEWEATRARWVVHVEEKARREMASRLRQWRAFVEDVMEAGSAEGYKENVRPRLVAERLLVLLPATEANQPRAELARLDARLAPFLVAGPFLLQPELQSCYSEEAFPFLYRRPRPSDSL